jgi:hypothetical protein
LGHFALSGALCAALALSGCVTGSSDDGAGGNGNGTAAAAPTGGSALNGAGNGNTAGNDPGGGAASVGGGNATSGANPGGANAGGTTPNGGGTSPNGGSANGGSANGGAGGAPPGSPTGIAVTTHDLTVPAGAVFNVADDYFNDGFIPATPVANFGCQSQITTVANDDGSLDVAWLDYTGSKGKPWAANAPAMIYLSHVDAALGAATTTASGVSTYKLLGFTKDAAGDFYLAYNKDHAFKTGTQGDQNNLNGNELHVTKLSGGAPVWDQLVFGNQDNNAEATLGDPGGAASGVLGYDATNQKLVLYLGHSMMWTGIRHQAGFLRLLNPASGAISPPSGQDIIHFGAGWWYSHNFNQRLLIDGGNYYVLAHGDAYSRQLGFARWSVNGYSTKNDTDFNESYFDIAGNEGDNNTNAQTGQLAKMKDGRFVITHTSSQGRSARDVRVVIASASNGKSEAGAVWLTSNQGTVQATMPKVEQLGDYLVVTYATWDSTKKHELVWYAALLDSKLATIAPPKVIPSVEFVDAAPLFHFKGGANANQLGWVSGNASHTLSVKVAKLAY